MRVPFAGLYELAFIQKARLLVAFRQPPHRLASMNSPSYRRRDTGEAPREMPPDLASMNSPSYRRRDGDVVEHVQDEEVPL